MVYDCPVSHVGSRAHGGQKASGGPLAHGGLVANGGWWWLVVHGG